MVVVRMIDGNGVSVQARSYMQLVGWQNTWEQAPGVPATRGALDNEELFVIEGSKTDPWRSTPENWRSAKNAAFHGEKHPRRHKSFLLK